MQPISRIILTWFILTQTAAVAQSVPYIALRSQAVNAARHMVGWNRQINRPAQDDAYFSFNIATEYTQSFHGGNLAHCLLGDDIICDVCNSTIHISGYDIPNRTPKDWFAPYFGLPLDFKSTFRINPTVENFIIDCGLYVGLDPWLNGLYMRFQGPFVHNRRRLHFQEAIENPGRLGYPQGWYGPHLVPGDEFSTNSSVTLNDLNANFTAYITGHVPDLPDDIAWQALACGKFHNDCNRGPMTCNAFGELQMILGWNFIAKERGHLGIGIVAAAPTGTRPRGEFMFETVIGNGKHWEFGVHVSSHVIFAENEAEDTSYGAYLEANITHLFAAHQNRSFDLYGKPNSRYMLAQKLGPLRLTPFIADPVYLPLPHNTPTDADAGVEFQNQFAPVANITCSRITSTIKVQGDVAFMLEYQSRGLQLDIGYNFWGRSCEELCPDPCCKDVFPEDTWALKGDAFVVGFEGTASAVDPATDRRPVRLAATQSLATIHAGTKGSVAQPSNNTADSPMYAFTNNDLPVLSRSNDNPADLAIQALSSNPPIYINQAAFDLAGTRGISNKIFMHLNYAWIEKDAYWVPYFGIGSEMEFGTSASCDDESCTYAYECEKESKKKFKQDCCGIQSCHDCAVSQWGIWIKVGLTYS